MTSTRREAEHIAQRLDKEVEGAERAISSLKAELTEAQKEAQKLAGDRARDQRRIPSSQASAAGASTAALSFTVHPRRSQYALSPPASSFGSPSLPERCTSCERRASFLRAERATPRARYSRALSAARPTFSLPSAKAAESLYPSTRDSATRRRARPQWGAMEFIDPHFDALSKIAGFPVDQVRYVACLLLAYPAAGIHKLLPSATVKHIYSIVVGLFFGYLCLREDIVHSFAVALGSYFLVKLGPARYSHVLVMMFALSYLSVSHIYRMYKNYMGWELDFTGPQMILTLKVSSFAFNVYDGRANKKATAEQEARALKRMPTLLEYLGYVYFFGGFLAGPAFEVREYIEFSDLTAFKADKDDKRPRVPSSLLPALGRMVVSFVCLGAMVAGGQYTMFRVTDAKFIASMPLIALPFYMWLAAFLNRCKYYFGWALAEGACVLSGLAYNGRDERGSAKWDRVSNMSILEIELAQNARGVINNWNVGTAVWLRRYVYERVPYKTKPNWRNTTVTYFVSAFWHGFYPGYYISFMTAALLTEAAKIMRRRVRPLVMKDEKTGRQPLKALYDLVSWVVTHLCMGAAVAPFILLDWHLAIAGWSCVYFWLPIVCGAVIAFNSLVPQRRARPAGEKKVEKKAE
eukprot:tig00000471_g1190.t1